MRRATRLGGWIAAAASTVLVLTGCTSTDTPRATEDEATVGTVEGIQDDLGSIPSWVGPFTGEIALADGLRPRPTAGSRQPSSRHRTDPCSPEC